MVSRSLLLLLYLAASLSAQAPLLWDRNGYAGYLQVGHAIEVADDLDGDGLKDVVVGVPTSFWTPGALAVVSGRDGTELFFAVSPATTNGDRFGFSVASMGDVDGDGYGDFAAGDPRFVVQRGIVRVVSGADGSEIWSVSGLSASFQSNVNARFGHSMDEIADLDGDGIRELIVGAPFGDPGSLSAPFDSGYVRVLSGVDGAILHHIVGLGSADHFGAAVTSLPDVDGDGFEDFAVGAPEQYIVTDNTPVYGSVGGYVDIYSGATGALLQHFEGNPTALFTLGGIGFSLDRAGDWDGDGLCDVVTGSPSGWPSRRAVVYSSGTGLQITSIDMPAHNTFGWDVAGDIDVDLDGHPDIVAGAPQLGAGQAFVFSGATGSLIFNGGCLSLSAQHGRVVTALGDVSGDGIHEFAVGSPGYDPGLGFGPSGRVEVRRRHAADRFGVGAGPDQTLVLERPVTPTTFGPVQLTGGPPSGNGWLIASQQSGPTTTAGGLHLLVPILAPDLGVVPITFDAAGDLIMPLDLRQPLLDGVQVNLQGLAVDSTSPFGGLYSSNGLRLLFAP